MKKLSALIALILFLGASTLAHAAGWNDQVDAAIKQNDYARISGIAASHPNEQGALAVYLLQQAQKFGNDPAREARIFATASSFANRILPADAGKASQLINATVKVASNKDFQNHHPREAADIFVNALNMSKQPNIAAISPNLHAVVLDAADDFVKAHPQDVDRRLLEQASLAESNNAAPSAPRGAVNVSPDAGAPAGTGVTGALQTAIANGDFNRVNVIAASNPGDQGAIAIYLLQQSQAYANTPDREVRIFVSATPFVGRISLSDVAPAVEIIAAMLKLAEDKDFQKNHSKEATDIFLSALNMSSQPNIVAYEPNLHAEVLEAANDFIKEHPSDADKKLLEEVSLAEAGGAPEVQPKGVINPSAE